MRIKSGSVLVFTVWIYLCTWEIISLHFELAECQQVFFALSRIKKKVFKKFKKRHMVKNLCLKKIASLIKVEKSSDIKWI